MSAGQRNRVARYHCEPMERRLLLCMADEIIENPMMIQPTYNWLKPTRPTNRGGPEAVADIVWTNRGQSSDRFASTFGANAAAARAVVDAVIAAWERVITNFNYSDGSGNYNVTISMDSAGGGKAYAPLAADNVAPGDEPPGMATRVAQVNGYQPLKGGVNGKRKKDFKEWYV